MKSKEFEIPSMSHTSFSSKKVLASVVAGLLFAAPVFATVETVAPSLGFAEHVAYASENEEAEYEHINTFEQAFDSSERVGLFDKLKSHIVSINICRSDFNPLLRDDIIQERSPFTAHIKIKFKNLKSNSNILVKPSSMYLLNGFDVFSATHPTYTVKPDGTCDVTIDLIGMASHSFSVAPLFDSPNSYLNIDCWLKKDNATNNKTPEQQQSIFNMMVNCDVIKKTNGKYRLIYAPKPFDGKVSVPLIPAPTEDKSQDWFPGLHNDQPPLRTTDNVKFIGENNNAYFTFIDTKADKPIETQVSLKASLYKQGKDILTGETPFKTFPGKIIFDNVDVNDKDVKDLIFVCTISAKGYSEPLFTPTTFKHFYTEDVEQAEELSTTLLALLKNVNNVKTSNNFKKSDDNLKQAYDKAITDGQAIYDKLSSTPEQVQQATEQIKSALGKLNGDAKAGANVSQLQNRIQQLEQELEQAKQQLDESQYEHIDMFGYTQGSKERDDLFEKLRPYIVSITDVHGNKVDEIYPFSAYAPGDVLWNVKLKNLRPGSKVHFLLDPTNAHHRMDADATATVASDGTCTITLNSIVPARGMLSGYRSFPVVDCWVKIDRAAELQQLKQQLQQTNQQLEQLKQDKTKSDEQKQKEIEQLNTKITELGKQIEKLTQENTTLKGQIAALQATVARLTQEANQCHASDGAKAQELEKVKKQLTQAQSDLEKLKTDKTQSDQEKQKEIDRLSNQVTQLNQEITKLKQEKSTLTQQLQDATSQVNTLNSQLDNLKNDKKQADEKNKQTISDLNTQVQHLTHDKQGLQEQITTKQKEIEKLNQEIQTLKDDHSKSDQEKQKEIERLSGQVNTLTQEKQALQGKLDAANEKVRSLTEQLEQAKQHHTTDASTIQSLTQQLQQTKQQLEDLKHNKTLSDQQKQAEIDKLNAQIAELGKQIEELTQENTSLKGQTATLQATVARLTQEANQCHVSDGEKTQELEKVKKQLTQAQSDLEKLKTDKTQSDQEKQKEIDKLNGQIADLGKQIEKLTKDKGELQTQLDTANGNITKLTGELEKAKQQGKADASTIQSLTEQLQQTKAALEKLKGDKTLSDTQKQTEIDKLNGQITNLGKQIEQLTKDKGDLQTLLDTAQQSLSEAQQKLKKAEEQGTADKSKISELTGKISTLNGQLEQLKNDKTKSEQEKQKEIECLSTQVTQLNQEITKLKQQDPASGSGASSDTSTVPSVSAGEGASDSTSLSGDVSAPASTRALYRLYNPWTGEHLFTTDAHEVQTLIPLGWRYEGIIGQASMQEGTAVYRLYNPNTGEHHYTTDLDEVARCVANGWIKEGIAFYSQGDQAVYSMYNPYAKSFYHHYTSDENEIAQMVKDGWKKEEVKWYCTSIQPKNLIK